MRGLRWGLALVGVLLLATLGWSSWVAWQVRSDLFAARDTAAAVQTQLGSGELDLALEGIPPLRMQLDGAAQRTHGTVWRVAEGIPLLGANFRAVRRVADSAQIVGADVLPTAADALSLARREPLLSNGKVDLAALGRVRLRVERSHAAMQRADRLVSAHAGHLLPPTASGLHEARATAAKLDEALRSAARGLALAPDMLGNRGARHYLVAVQNDAEARATGGLVGAFAIVSTDHGAIHLDRTGVNDELTVVGHPLANDPAAARTWVNVGSTSSWFATNLTPHFPDVGQNLAGIWRHTSGQVVDGVIAVDPLVMAELLRVTGPIQLQDGTRISADDVASFIGRDEYVRYPDLADREQVLSRLAEKLFERVLVVNQPDQLVRSLSVAAGSGHLFIWSRHATEQAELRDRLVGGALPAQSTPYLAVLTQNFGGNKLDYYLRRKVTIRAAGKGRISVEVRLRNTVPLGLPDYVTVRSDNPKPPKPYGQSKVAVSVYGAISSEVFSVSLDGRPTTMAFDSDHGHRFGTTVIELPRNKEVVLALIMSQPSGTVEYRRQPLVVPEDIDAHIPLRVVGR
jgi:hypothetical protein